ncbi:hypothetical protein ACTOB_001183 [Actinoplanes oblitus]|uniref:FtsK domain-containing protein n=1 Tax=Actinoplanes oblitus TaxID=3040509 RepID=A0ABY8WIC6_9ACTN|nr:hypothetical protein [Actinoplanes oblitus]WIM97641.1 hypothetical protein ACTOB_001183 [Actinoplanes oblitus]
MSWWIGQAYGWPALVGAVSGLGAAIAIWWRFHPASWLRFGWFPLVGRCRRLWIYRRGRTRTMTACGLAAMHGGQRWVPRLLGVRSDQWGDRVTVRLLPGQHPDDWAKAAPRLAYSFHLREARAFTSDRPDRVVLYFARRDPLAAVVGPLPVPAAPDLAGLEVGRQEAGSAYRLRLAGSHVLIAGATNSSKGSVIWSLLRSLATGISSGWSRCGRSTRRAAWSWRRARRCSPGSCTTTRRRWPAYWRRRSSGCGSAPPACAGSRVSTTPTVDEPLILVLVDELAALTAYLTDRKIRDRSGSRCGRSPPSPRCSRSPRRCRPDTWR